MRPMLLVVIAGSVALAGCGYTCQNTCRRFYAETECDAGPDGFDIPEAIDRCTLECGAALQATGPAPEPTDGRFNPDRIAPANLVSTLDNELEAAAWMDCVWSFSDDECPSRLDDQYCAKIF